MVLAFATDGAAGLSSAVVGGAEDGRLARHRRAEAQAAALELGASRVIWLGYADSGMVDSPSTGPGRFVDVPVPEAARLVAAILDEEDADVLTGYDCLGGYGHPDHVQVHRVARAAQGLAARRPRLLEATLDRTWLVRVLRVLRPFGRLLPGLTLPGDRIFTARDDLSLTVDVRHQLAAKRAALAEHGSQAAGGVRTVGLLRALPRPLARLVLGTEWFVEVR